MSRTELRTNSSPSSRLCTRTSSINKLRSLVQDISIKKKLIGGFLLIVLVNGASGFLGVRIIGELGRLIRQTYDQALMSGTFALSAKFDLAEYDLALQGALLADDRETFTRESKKATRALETLREDLDVTRTRALGKTEVEAVLKNLTILEKKSDDLLRAWSPERKLALLRQWRADKLLARSYRQLTAIYDDAAVVGYKFRLSSEEKIDASLKWSTIILLASLVGSFALSTWLSILIISPLYRMVKTCEDVAVGNFSVRARQENRDEFGMLASSFNIMLDVIEEKRENMSALLKTIPFALFYFDRTGKLSEDRSVATARVLPDLADHQDIFSFFGAFGTDPEDVRQVVESMYENALPFSSAAFLLPQSVRMGDPSDPQIVELSYQAQRNSKKKIERVIILGEDVTEKIRARARSAEHASRVERLSRASADLHGFRSFLPEVRGLMRKIHDQFHTPDEDLLRDLHSLKGALGIFSFTAVAEKVHALETELAATRAEPSSAVHRLLGEIKELFEHEAQDVVRTLALDQSAGLSSFDEGKIRNLRDLAMKSGDQALAQAAKGLDHFPPEQIFAKYANYLRGMTEKTLDKKVRLEVLPGPELSYEELRPLDPVLIHVFNNSLDHGIESADERLAHGKPEFGEIRLGCSREDKNLILTISDDGKGIDGERLLQKARTEGLVGDDEALSPEDCLELIFRSGLSTKEEVTLLSGRGVGMDAVKSFLEKNGGSIRVTSRPLVGTTFTITFPTGGPREHSPA